MKTIALRFVAVVLGIVAGGSGCNSQSQGKLPALPESAAIVETSSHTGTAPNIAEIPLAETPETAKAKPVNPRVAKFAELDSDQDGMLSLSEFGVGRTSKDATKWFERRDVNHDGLLSLAEFVPQSASSAGGKSFNVDRGDNGLPPVNSLNQ